MSGLDYIIIFLELSGLDLNTQVTEINSFLFSSVLSDPTVDSGTNRIAGLISILPFLASLAGYMLQK